MKVNLDVSANTPARKVLNKVAKELETPTERVEQVVRDIVSDLEPMSSARCMLERRAEELSPEDYIRARSYLANMEMDEIRSIGEVIR